MIVNKYNKGGGGSPFDPTEYYTKAQTDAAITAATEDLATEEYVDAAISGISLDGYWTSGETEEAISDAIEDLASEDYVDAAISGLTDMMETKEGVVASALTELNTEVLALSGATGNYATHAEVTAATQGFATQAYVTGITSPIQSQVDDVERVTATAYTELHQDIVALSGATSGYATHAEVTAATQNMATQAYVTNAITAATQDFVTENDLTGYTSAQDFDDFVDTIEVKEGVIASALTELNETKVESTDITSIEKVTQAEYDALVSGGTVNSTTFYIITSTNNQ